MLNKKLSELTFVAFDIETSGSYPLTNEICEIAGVKYKNPEIVSSYQRLAKTLKPMSDFIISIHGITNEMLQQELPVSEFIADFYEYIKDSIPIAHHSPFDMGFIALEFERKNLLPPINPVLCTSLLSRKLIPESPNHKLQTLVGYLGIEKNTAHRALDDAQSCLQVMKKCFDKIGWDKTLEEVIHIQGKKILWNSFYMKELNLDSRYVPLIHAIKEEKEARIIIKFGKGTLAESIKPVGLVRSPDGDFVFAYSQKEKKIRRYYLEKILESEVVS